MAIIGFIIGSIVGFIAALFSWLGLEMPAATALGIHVATSLCFGLTVAFATALRGGPSSADGIVTA